MSICAILRPWRMPRRQALAPLQDIAETALEVGDLEFAHYSRFLGIFFTLLAGDRIPDTAQRLADLADELRRSGHLYPQPEICRRPYRLLQASDAGAVALDAELAATEVELSSGGGNAETYARTLWMMVLCVYGRWELALAQSERMGERLFQISPYVHIADHTFYRGLAAAALAEQTRGLTRWQHRRRLRTCARRLQRWERAGVDFAHMALGLEAERARLAHNDRRARILYEKATRRAREQQFPNHAALLQERLGSMLGLQRRRTEASAALAQAAALYREWGAADKAAALEQELSASGEQRVRAAS
jgi:hypothetical protein